jgi:hypothetical protein
MATPKQLAANRANARKSQGPRTAAGKARSSRNAFRHGLAAITCYNLAILPEIECIALAICGEDKNPLLLEHARVIAEAQMVLDCASAEQIALIEYNRDPGLAPCGSDPLMQAEAKFRRELLRSPILMEAIIKNFVKNRAAGSASKPEPGRLRSEVEVMADVMPEFQRIGRYERRAWSRRKRALLRFIEAKAESDNLDTKENRETIGAAERSATKE